MLKRFVIAAICCLSIISATYAQQPNPLYKLKGSDYVAGKNYYLLTLMQSSDPVKKMLESDVDLQKICTSKIEALKSSLNCKDAACFTAQLKFTDDEIKQVGDKLSALYHANNALGQLVKTDLIPSGAYVFNKDLAPQQQLVKAWEQDAAGVNYAIAVYADGKKPQYATIDSISFDVKAKTYPGVLLDVASVMVDKYQNSKLFFEPVLGYALQAMEINGRHDAANFEPLAEGINKETVLKIAQTQWSKYKYSSILILGAGPGDYTTEISATGMLRCKMGAERYFSGLAPFIIVSGGMAHPYKTKNCEAVGMKNYLINNLHVPANAIIAETQARHTTTNVRNGVRLMYHYGIPPEKAFLTVSSKSHVTSLKEMGIRCLKELKCIPYKLGNRIDDNAWEMYPAIEALQINPMEPLDPR